MGYPSRLQLVTPGDCGTQVLAGGFCEQPPRLTILFRLYEPLSVRSQPKLLASTMVLLIENSSPSFEVLPMFSSRVEVGAPAEGGMIREISASRLVFL